MLPRSLDLNILTDIHNGISEMLADVTGPNCCKLNTSNKYDLYIKEIKDGLNKFFPDKKCASIIYTDNTDNDFFGIMVKPHQWSPQIILDENNINESFNKYVVEFDSRLFTAIGIGSDEIMACLIHDVDRIIDTNTVNELKFIVDGICAELHIVPDYISGKQILQTFKFCAEESLYQLNSVFAKSKDELVLATEVLRDYELSASFENAIDRIVDLRCNLDRDTRDKTLMLNWFFNWSKDATSMDTLPVYILQKAIDCTGSILLKNSANTALVNLSNVGRNTYVEESSKKKSLINRIKYDGLKSLEDDIYEYAMRVKNIDDEASAVHLMRQINSRMSIISDYLCEEELTDAERKRWDKLYDKYDKVREEMIKKPIYSRKMYGLFVDYNALMNMNSANQLTMNTMY